LIPCHTLNLNRLFVEPVECSTIITFLKSEPKIHVPKDESDNNGGDEDNLKEKKDRTNEEKDWIEKGDNLRETIVHYWYDDINNNLELRVDSIIKRSLLVPMLAVVNESDLYKT